MKKISIIIVAHNKEKTLSKTIESVLAQNYPPNLLEIIYVDDGSTDDSVNISQLSRVDLVIKHNNRKGISWARNQGIDASSGEIIFFIDSDIYLIKNNSLKIISNHFERNPKLAGVCGSYKSLYQDNDGNICRDIRRRTLYKKNAQKRLITLLDFTTFSGGFGAYRRSIFKKLKFDEHNFNNCASEDLLIELLFLQRGYAFLYDPELEGIHDHRLSLIETLRKMILEIRGKTNVLLTITAQEENFNIPFLPGCFTYPFTFAIGILLLLISPFFLPFLIFLLLPEIISACQCFFSTHYSLKNKILATAYCFSHDLIALIYFPYYLIRNKKIIGKEGNFKKIIKNILQWEKQKWLYASRRVIKILKAR